MMDIQQRLFELRDKGYGDFNAALIPTLDRELIIGVRTPMLRKLAKELSKSPQADEFLSALPHEYFEEDGLHAFLIGQIKDYERCIEEINRFLPYVDNWATCDSLRPQIFKDYRDRLICEIRNWLCSEHCYTVRYGIEMLMCHYLGGDFSAEYPAMVAAVQSDEYYVKMMVAWYFATALAVRYEEVLPYIREQKLDKWTHNKAIQKAVESYRISDERKTYLKTLKIR